MDGWIRLHRKMWENPIVTKDSDHIAIWVYLLSNAAFKDTDVEFNGKRITLHPGQLTIGTMQLADRLGISKTKTYRVLQRLKSETQIEIQTSSKCSLISIVNWDLYQADETQSETQVKRKRNASETPVKTKEECKNVRKKEIYIKPSAESWINLILNTGEEYPIYREDIDNYKALYPAVDVEQELRKMRGWCLANPNKCKTKGGIKRFVNGWLAKEQDKPKAQVQPTTNKFHNFEQRATDYGNEIENFNKMMGDL